MPLKYLNVQIEESVIDEAKVAARRQGMLLKAWVERALQAASKNEQPVRAERTYEPAE